MPTDLDPEFDEAKSLVFLPIPNGHFHTYTIDLSSVDSWQGRIKQINQPPLKLTTSGSLKLRKV